MRVGDQDWQAAINVGANDDDDGLVYRMVYDFRHEIVESLKNMDSGFLKPTPDSSPGALDFQRSDILKNTAAWRRSDAMDGSNFPQPVASLLRPFHTAIDSRADVYFFGRLYDTGDGVHDTHMNQGSTGGYLRRSPTQPGDLNAVWEDGAVIFALPDDRWAAYFAAFEKQFLPTDDLGNPGSNSEPITQWN